MSWKLAARAAGVEKAGAAPQGMTQPNDAKRVCSVSWHSKRSPVHQMPQERRQNARLEARAITACCSWRELRLLEQQSRDTEEGMLSGISQKHNMRSARNPAIHNAFRTSLRRSSLFEPRHPSLKVVSSEKAHAARDRRWYTSIAVRRSALSERGATRQRERESTRGSLSPHCPREPA